MARVASNKEVDNLEVNDRNVMSNFEPGEYMKEMFFFQSVTQSAGKKTLEYSQQEVHISMNNKHFCNVRYRLTELTFS